MIEALLQAVPSTTPAEIKMAVEAAHKCMSTELITAFTGAAVIVVGAVAAAAVRIIKAVNSSSKAIVVEQTRSREFGRIRDRNSQKIHLLVNSRLTSALRLVAAMAQKTAERTGLPEDIEAAAHAKKEFDSAVEADNGHLERVDENDEWDGSERRRFARK